MKDPLLLTFAIREKEIPKESPFLFDISSGLNPISIRDQLFRANSIIKRALSEGIIRSGQQEPILIIGGGAAGLTAAMTAVQNRVPVVLVERQKFFATQAPSGRTVCATEYNWPQAEWSSGAYPADPLHMPLQLKTKLAVDLLTTWDSQLGRWKTDYKETLDLKVGTVFDRYERVGNAIRAHLKPPDPNLPPFKVVISCAGFGLEKTWLPAKDKADLKYRGFAFWEQDLFEEENVGLEPGERPNVIICGAGDGALQDFLRITFRKPAGEIYALMSNEAKQLIEERILRAEDRALRQFVWGNTGVLDHPIHQQLQSEHQTVVDLLFSDRILWDSIKAKFDPLIGDLDKRMDLAIAYSCDHFGNCYPLNRFLVLLINKYLSSVLKMTVLMPKVKVIDVVSLGHDCLETSFGEDGKPLRDLLGDPFYCHGKAHDLKYAEAVCQTFDSAGTESANLKKIERGPFNIIIVRYGISGGKLPLTHTASALPMRQIIPYDNPW